MPEREAARLELVDAFDGMVSRIDGRMMSGPTPSFRELSRALRFPSYFGYSWDALDECLGDVRWLDRDAILVVTEHGDALVATAHLPMLVDVLCSGSERAGASHDEDGVALDRVPTALHFVILLEQGNLEEIARRLRGIERRQVAVSTCLAIS
ncbi:barstar family protein [Plantactinospora sp. CA-290183]|uniref:barstar family protein n=1 Tax=Plantactinospora sp. CA-290183 TaxID=3240006 RepID=UPI003D8E3037